MTHHGQLTSASLCCVLLFVSAPARSIGPFNIDSIRKVPTVTYSVQNDTVRKFNLASEMYNGKRQLYSVNFYLPSKRTGKVPAIIYLNNPDQAQAWLSRGYAFLDCGYGASDAQATFGGSTNATDYWIYQDAASLSHLVSWLSVQPEIDSTRIGLFGGSWGAVVAFLASGVDDRYRAVIICAGSGYMAETEVWSGYFATATANDADKNWFTNNLDPKNFVPYIKAPILWLNETNDGFFEPSSCYKSRLLANTQIFNHYAIDGHNGLCNSFAGWDKDELMDAILKPGSTAPLAKITGQGNDGKNLWMTYSSQSRITSAIISYTTGSDSQHWSSKTWTTNQATVDAANKKVTAPIPTGATVAYLDMADSLGRSVGSEYFPIKTALMPPPATALRRPEAPSAIGSRRDDIISTRQARLLANSGLVYDIAGRGSLPHQTCASRAGVFFVKQGLPGKAALKLLLF